MVPWERIETVLLDMDGTLLDLYFDQLLWSAALPQRFSEQHGVSFAAAQSFVGPRLMARKGTLAWYCLDHWTREFGVDISALEHELAGKIRVHPHVEEFLTAVKASGRALFLTTNAHRRSLDLKMSRTGIARYFDGLVSAHDFGHPKEDQQFWVHLREKIAFEPAATLFIDDNPDVLQSAADFGIAHLIAVARPDSSAARLKQGRFAQIDHFGEMLPLR